MSIVKTTALFGRPLGRLICTTLAVSLFYSANAFSINPLVTGLSAEAQQRLENMARKPKGHYTDKPTRVYYGEKPGRDPIGRGGIWTPKLLLDLQKVKEKEQREAPIAPNDLMLSMSPLFIATPPPGGGEGEGGSLPGEGEGEGGGSSSGGGSGGGGISQLNTNTGNRYVNYPIVSWSARGDSGVNFNLHHNSKGAYTFDLGKGWSHDYDIKISYTLGSSAIVRYGNGTTHPYTETLSGTFDAPAGVHDTLVHNTNNTWTLTAKNRTKYEFNTSGRLVTVKDKNNNAVSIYRDGFQKITSINDGTGRNLTFSYNAWGLISQVTDPTGRVWSLTYNGNNDMTGLTYPALNSQLHTRYFTYNTLSDILTETDLRGKVWSFAYDSSERLTGFTNPLGNSWSWAYTNTSATMTQPNAKTITHNYSNGLIASEVDQAGYSEAYLYDTDRNVTSRTDKKGKVWGATYNSSGDTLSTTNPLGKTTSFTYNVFSDLLSVTDPLGSVNSFSYDSNSNLLNAVDGLARIVTTRVYDAYGQTTSEVDALGRSICKYYDSYGNLTHTVDSAGIDSWATYDLLGHINTLTDGVGNTSLYVRDEWSRITSFSNPGGALSTLTFDLEGEVTVATDALGNVGYRYYDDAGRLTSAFNAKGESTSYGYDSLNRVVSITNARGYTRTNSYSDRGELISLTLPDGSAQSWSYSGTGQVTAYVNAVGQTILHAYDNADQQIAIDYPAGMTDVTVSYDDSGRQVAMTDGTGTSSHMYNAAGELTALSTPQGGINYAYYADGQIASVTRPGIGSTTVSYDSSGRIASVTDANGDTTQVAYDIAGRINQRTNPNGTFETYGYNSRNLVTSIVTKDANQAVLSDRAYSFNALDEVVQVTENGVVTSYAYDSIGQLLSEIKSSGYSAQYTYDANGNRLSRNINGVIESYQYDSGDKLLAVSGGADPRAYLYDTAGRTTGIVRSAGTTALSYDAESQLISVSKPGMPTSSFDYNGSGARIKVTDSSGTRNLLRDGLNVLSPILSDGQTTFTSSGDVKSGIKRYYHSALKSVDLITSTSGAVVAGRTFDAFGNVLSSVGSWSDAAGYGGNVGYVKDSDTGFLQLGHRYYDSETGRFLTRDPAMDGRNWYSYCGNSPVTYFDADGLQKEIVILIGDLNGVEASVSESLAYLIDEYEKKGYKVIIKVVRNEDDLVEALTEYDEAVLVGHGAPFVYAGNGGACNIDRVTRRVQAGRIKAGKGRMSSIVFWSCYACMDKKDREYWFRITQKFWGSDDLLYFPRGGKYKRKLWDGGKWYKDGNPGYIDNVKKWGGGSVRGNPY